MEKRQNQVEAASLNEKNEPVDADDFDGILEIVGSQGRYQKILLYAVVCPIIALQPFITLNAIFMLNEPDHWCHIPGQDTSNDTWKALKIPKIINAEGIEDFSQCSMFDDARNGTTECTNGWDYDKTDFDSTIPTEFNWVCTKEHYATDAFTLYYVGNVFGTIIFGQASDKFGRKPVFFLTIFINLFFRLVSLFIPQYFLAFLAAQFLIGTSFPVMFIGPSMIVAEVSDKEYRAWVYSMTWVVWVIGMATLPLIAWLSRGWFLLGILTSVPLFLLLIYWRFTPESPRWLISRGHNSRAAKIILDIAKTNGREDRITPSQLDAILKGIAKNKGAEDDKPGIWMLFTRFRLAKNTILLTISWSLNVLIYYVITLNTPQMDGNQFLNFAILSLIEIPAGYLGGFLVDRLGRRWVPVAFFFGCALSCFAAGIGVTHKELTAYTTFNVIMAKFCITLTFLIVYLQGTEIFPTNLRSTGSGFAATAASALGISGPTIVSLGRYHAGAPYMTLGGLCIVGMIASALLPETLNRKLPETLEDASFFGENDKFWSVTKPTEDT